MACVTTRAPSIRLVITSLCYATNTVGITPKKIYKYEQKFMKI